MLTVVTGLPGAGKTLYTLQYVDAWAKREGRPVYYSGIKELTLPWIELDNVEQWFALPAGAIVVVDEAQRHFRPRAHGTVVPRHVSELETHRHSGVDVVLITQHPMLLDQNVRRLTGRHFHVVRAFGMKRSTVHEWQAIKDNCDKSRRDSTKHEWAYPTKYFSAYKSAELHTHKARIPARLILVLLCPFILFGLGWYVYKWATTAVPDSMPKTGVFAQAPAADPVLHSTPSRKKTYAEWLAEQSPRIAGLAHTAPIFDEVTQPVRAPVPAACAASKASCRCYSQQGTRLDMDATLCRSIVERGYFVAWDEKPLAVDRPRDRELPLKGSSAEQDGASSVLSFDGTGAAQRGDLGTRDRSAAIAANLEQGSEPEPVPGDTRSNRRIPGTSPLLNAPMAPRL